MDRTVIEKRIATYPAGALEFNLQALHDDPIPALEAELARLSGSNLHSAESSELVMRLSTEKDKRQRWAVRKHDDHECHEQ
jgi:ubiquitin carboxyl-terminal hydrolase L5